MLLGGAEDSSLKREKREEKEKRSLFGGGRGCDERRASLFGGAGDAS